MLALVVAEFFADDYFRWKYFTNWGVYITFLVSTLLMCSTIKYLRELKNFGIKLRMIKAGLESLPVDLRR